MNANKSEKSSTQSNLKVAPAIEPTKTQPMDPTPEVASKEKHKAQKPESSQLSQREAVYSEIIRVLKEDKVAFDCSSSVKPLLTEERLKRVYEGIAQGFRGKKVALKDNANNQKKLAEPALLHTYIIGLTNNWVRRDERLNGKGSKKI